MPRSRWWLRAVAAWGIIILIESILGALRTVYAEPAMGSLRARQLAVPVACMVIYLVSRATVRWIGGREHMIATGVLWVTLTVSFEVALGRLVFDLPWSRITEDYNLIRGGLMPFGLLFMAVAPWLSRKRIGSQYSSSSLAPRGQGWHES